MVSEENSEPALVVPHETPQVPPAVALALPRPPSDRDRQICAERLQILRAVDAIVEQGKAAGVTTSVSAACAQVGIPQATYCRYRDAYAAAGEDGLTPGWSACGRKSSWDKHVPAEMRQWLILRLQELNGRIGDAATAVRIIAEEPDCPESLAIYLRSQKRFPQSVLRAAHINGQIRAKFKGPRAYQLNSIFNLRTMTEVIDGKEVPINPGDWWELDDMSLNQPFWFEVPNGDHPDWRGCTVDGIALGRQGLYAQDIASGKWLGHLLIGRPRDAYRAEDILRYLKLLMETWGKPRRGLRLERGIWRSKRITGYKLRAQYGGWDPEIHERAAMAQGDYDALIAGIKSLGIEVAYCYSPNQKGFIEGGFRLLQKYMSATPYQDIGRQRGENEAATEAMLHAKAGRSHPAARGFAHIEQISKSLTWAESWLNNHHKDGRLQRGIPDHNWVASRTRWPIKELTQDDHAVFLPERSELQIRGCHVTPRFQGQLYQFMAPELFAECGNGYRLMIAFDPSDLAAGAAVWNAEGNTLANRHGWKLGQFLGWAQYEAPVPQFGRDESENGQRTVANRKIVNNWHRTSFKAIKDFGGESRSESAARDGRGNTVSLDKRESSTTPTRTESTPVPTPRAIRPTRGGGADTGGGPATPIEGPRPLNTTLLARQAARSRQMFEESE